MTDDTSEWRKVFGNMTVDEAREALNRLLPWTPERDKLPTDPWAAGDPLPDEVQALMERRTPLPPFRVVVSTPQASDKSSLADRLGNSGTAGADERDLSKPEGAA